MKIILVYNKKSGSQKTLNDIKATCRRAGLSPEAFIAVDKDLRTNLTPHAKDGNIIVAIGGDGTHSAVAGMLAGTKTIFAPIAGGTLNHFTKDTGVDQDFETALNNISKKRVRVVDVAVCNNRVFINNSSIGIYPSSLQVRQQLEAHIGKWLAAIVAGFHSFVAMKTYEVTIDNETIRTPFVFVGNGIYKIDSPGIANRADIASGAMSVFVAKTVSRWKLLRIALLTLVGRAAILDDFDIFTVKNLTVLSSHKRLAVSTDGEINTQSTPLKYKIQAKSLRVLY